MENNRKRSGKGMGKCTALHACIMFSVCLLSVNASAYDIEQDGLFYTVDLTTKTAVLDSCDVAKIGSVAVPSSVMLKTREFKVATVSPGAFKNCKSLSSVEIPDSIAISSNAFLNCVALKSVALPSTIEELPNGIFYGCSNLSDVVIPNTVNTIKDNAFYGCKNLNSINIPDKVSEIGSCAFEGCESLSVINLPNTITDIGNRTFASTGLKSITIPVGIDSLSNGLFASSSLESISLPDNMVSIGDSVFFQSQLRSVSLPEGLSHIGAFCFAGSKIESISLPKYLPTILAGTFIDCKLLKDVEFNDNISRIERGAFANCVSIEKLNLPDNIESLGEWGKDYVDWGTFEGCENLKSIHLPNNITSFDYEKTFSKCINLKYLLLPDKLNYVYPEQFSDSGIEELDLTESNTGTTYVFKGSWPSSLKRLAIASVQKQTDYSAMRRLDRLKVLPQAKEFERTVEGSRYYFAIEADSLYLCDSASPLNAHKSYGNNQYYRNYGDYKYLYMGRNLTIDDESCNIEESVGSDLQTLVIGPLVTEIRMDKAESLKSIESKITVPLQVEPSFPKDIYINVPLTVPYGTKSQYEQAPGWKEFFDIQESDENTNGIVTTAKHADDKTEVARYNANGQRILKSEAGINIVRFNDGSIEKTVVRH